MLTRSELHEDKITRPIHEKEHRCDWYRSRAANNIYVIGLHVKNAV